MRLGIPKEKNKDETRVSVVPISIPKLNKLGFDVVVEKGAGEKSGYLDSEYEEKGGKIKKFVDIALVVDSSSTPRIQEVHRTIYHIICELVEKHI